MRLLSRCINCCGLMSITPLVAPAMMLPSLSVISARSLNPTLVDDPKGMMVKGEA